MDAPEISVIIVNYNGRRWLEDCLRSLAAQRGSRAEVILVDNGSTDESAAFVRDAFPEVRLVEVGRNAGYSAGNNAGAARAGGRLLAFLNNDTRAHANWLRSLADAFTSPDVALATSRIVVMDRPEIVDSAGDGYTTAGGAFKRHHGGSAADPVAVTAADVFGACGAACMIRRDVFEELGGFDEDFFMVYEDVDLSYRALLAGYRCVYVPEAVVEHAVSATLGSQSPRSVFFGQRNLEWTFIQNTPGRLLLRSWLAHLAYDVAAAAYFIRRRRFGAFVRGKIAAVAGLRRALSKRRRIQRARRASVDQIAAAMDRHWLRIKRREKTFVSTRRATGHRRRAR